MDSRPGLPNKEILDAKLSIDNDRGEIVGQAGQREIVQLVIKREQAPVKSLLGGHKGVEFTLAYRLVLSDEECELADRYKLGAYPVTWKNLPSGQVPDDTIRDMVAGRNQTLSDVTTLVANEKAIKDACDLLPKLFEIVRTFGGEEVIDYPRDSGR